MIPKLRKSRYFQNFLQHLMACEPLAKLRATILVHPMHLEHPLGEIQADFDGRVVCEPLPQERQAALMMHRARTVVVSNRTAQVNQIRGLLGELGLIVPVGIKRLRKQ